LKSKAGKLAVAAGLAALVILALLCPRLLRAQGPWGFAPPTTPMAQRNALNVVQSQVNWLQNSARTASGYDTGAYGMVWQQFSMLCTAYNSFKATLTQQQLAAGANEWAELDAGLGILQEAFKDYQQEVAAGQSSASALRRMCQDLDEAAGVWWQELSNDSVQLSVGWQ